MDLKSTLAAVSLSAAVIVLWGLFFAPLTRRFFLFPLLLRRLLRRRMLRDFRRLRVALRPIFRIIY